MAAAGIWGQGGMVDWNAALRLLTGVQIQAQFLDDSLLDGSGGGGQQRFGGELGGGALGEAGGNDEAAVRGGASSIPEVVEGPEPASGATVVNCQVIRLLWRFGRGR